MKYERLEKIEQVRDLKIGDVIPMLDRSSHIDGRMKGMLIDRTGNDMLFLTQNEMEEWYCEWLICGADRRGNIDESGRYFFDGEGDGIVVNSVKYQEKAKEKFRGSLSK